MPSRLWALMQLDQSLAGRGQPFPVRPPGGWVRAIRSALGMTTAQLGKRIGVSQRLVSDLELRESLDTVTLGSLRKAAAALNCELQYALVPREGLAEMVKRQARDKVAAKMAPVAHSMRLENQAVSDSAVEFQIEEASRDLIERRARELWS